MRRMLPAMLGLLVLTGCALFPQSGSWDPFAGADARQLAVRVENVALDDVRITAILPGRRVELGLVGARTRRGFSLPWSGMQEIRFQIEPMTSTERHTTMGITAGPGEFVELVVRSPVQNSSVRR